MQGCEEDLKGRALLKISLINQKSVSWWKLYLEFFKIVLKWSSSFLEATLTIKSDLSFEQKLCWKLFKLSRTGFDPRDNFLCHKVFNGTTNFSGRVFKVEG